RAPADAGAVLAGGVGEGNLRAALRLRRRDRRRQRGRPEAEGARRHLRAPGAGGARVRPSQEVGLEAMAKKILTLIKLQIPAGQAWGTTAGGRRTARAAARREGRCTGGRWAPPSTGDGSRYRQRRGSATGLSSRPSAAVSTAGTPTSSCAGR